MANWYMVPCSYMSDWNCIRRTYIRNYLYYLNHRNHSLMLLWSDLVSRNFLQNNCTGNVWFQLFSNKRVIRPDCIGLEDSDERNFRREGVKKCPHKGPELDFLFSWENWCGNEMSWRWPSLYSVRLRYIICKKKNKTIWTLFSLLVWNISRLQIIWFKGREKKFCN